MLHLEDTEGEEGKGEVKPATASAAWLRCSIHMKHILMFSFLAAVLVGCSKQSGLSLSGTRGSGDLVPLAMQCMASRGGHAFTNALPVVKANWTLQSRDIQDIILVDGDHFAELQKALEQAFGTPDTKLGSSIVAPVGAGQFIDLQPSANRRGAEP